MKLMIYAKDFIAMESFYTNVLGLQPLEATRLAGWLEFGEGLALHAIPEHIAKEIVITSPPEVREETPMKPIIPVNDLDARIARLEAAGVPVKRYAWGAADCVDPEGNVIQISR